MQLNSDPSKISHMYARQDSIAARDAALLALGYTAEQVFGWNDFGFRIRTAPWVELRRKVFCAMTIDRAEPFPFIEVARACSMDHSTVLHHVRKEQERRRVASGKALAIKAGA